MKEKMHLEFSTATQNNIRAIIATTAIMMFIGIGYVLLISDIHPHAILIGAADGIIIGLTSTLVELYYFNVVCRRMRFWTLLLLRTAFYVVLISSSITIVSAYHLTVMNNISFGQTFDDKAFQQYLFEGKLLRDVAFVLIVVFVINFMRQINRLLGQSALLSFITGKYYKPIEEQRIFMFVDLKNSTTIAEKLKHKEYHNFLNEFFYDITPAIVESKGEIYQYVGDEVVITWDAKRGLKDANCIKCFFRISTAIHTRSVNYEKKYGIVPTFKAGYHYGPVIAGEIGDVKKEIVFHGDTVNTAARIRSECTKFNKDVLLSSDLLDRVSITDYLTPESIGRIKLRGKEEEIELYSIAEAA